MFKITTVDNHIMKPSLKFNNPLALFVFLAELECLFWGLYFNTDVLLSSSKKGLHMLTEKWSGTLRELDITNHLFTEEDLEIAMGHLAHTTSADSLRSLHLTGTRITTPALR